MMSELPFTPVSTGPHPGPACLVQDCLLVQASLTGHLFCFQLLPSPVNIVLDLIELNVHPLDFAYGFLQLATLPFCPICSLIRGWSSFCGYSQLSFQSLDSKRIRQTLRENLG